MEGADTNVVAGAVVVLPTYVAFLRGINVGGNMPVNMDDLKKLFEARKFKNVRTVIGSGNVLFETTGTDVDAMTHDRNRAQEEIQARCFSDRPLDKRTRRDGSLSAL